MKLSKNKRKVTKLENFTKKLEAEMAEKTAMAEQIKVLQAEIEAMKSAGTVGQDSHLTLEKDVHEEGTMDFENEPSASSTWRTKLSGSLDESRFLSSVNQLSISSIAVPECKPVEGEDEIHRRTFEM